MATVEVFTIGGGEYVVNVLNAVAAWTGDGGYKGMIQVVLVMGLAYAAICMAFDQDWRSLFRWFLGSTLIYMCLMLPRYEVHVTDRINPGLAPSDVANVPLGLALTASFTSQLGDYLTQKAEVVFGLPNQLEYSQNGIVYGARLYEATQQVRLSDPVFATNLDQYYKNCTFYDILLGFKSMQALATSTDLWQSLGPGSPARSMPYLVAAPSGGATTTNIVTCATAYQSMSDAWSAAINVTGTALGRKLYSKLDNAAAQAKLFADLPVATQYMLGVSQSAADQLKQIMAINAMTQAMHTAQNAPSGVDVYAQTRAEMQTSNSYSAISYAAMKWVPLLNIVLTVLFYALFPILFPLFLFPRTGPTALTGYVTGFFYLAVWGPLYVILNMILMIKTGSDAAAAAAASPGLTLSSYVGISGVMSDASMLAGYLIASVPFLAGGIASGARAISSQATSFLAPSQSAAEESARDITTGNISVGNSSFDNQTVNTRQSSQWTTAAAYTGGSSAFTRVNSDGSRATQFESAEVVDEASGISRFSFTPQLSHEFQSSVARSAAQSRSKAETFANSASSSTSTALTNASDFRSQLSVGDTLERSYGADDRSTIGKTYSQVDQAATLLQNRFGWDRSRSERSASEYLLNGTLSADAELRGSVGGLGRVGVGLGGKAGYSRTAGTTAQDSANNSVSEARDLLSSNAQQNNWSDLRDAFSRASRNTNNASLRSKAESIGSSFTRANTASQESRRSYETAERFDKAASLRDSNGISLSENLSQPFLEYVLREQSRLPGITPAWNPTRGEAKTPEELGERDFYIRNFVKQREDAIQSGVEPELVLPTPAGITRPGVSTQAGIRKLSSDHERAVGRHPELEIAGHGFEQFPAFVDGRRQEVRDASTLVDTAVESRRAELTFGASRLSSDPKATLRGHFEDIDRGKAPKGWLGRKVAKAREALDPE